MDNPDALEGRTVEQLRELIRGLRATVAQQRRHIEALQQGPGHRPGFDEPGPRHAPRSLYPGERNG